MRNVSDKSCRENQNTYFMFRGLLSENHEIYKIMWKNMVVLARPQMTIHACRITRATNTHPECLILIAFPCQDTIVGIAACYRLDGSGIKFP